MIDKNQEISVPMASWFGIFYGWVMLAVTTITMICTSPGQTYGISAFNISFRESLNLSDTKITGAYMLGTLLASLPMTYVGAMFDRYGGKRTLSIVTLLFGITCISTSRVSGLFTIFLAFLFLRMLGQGAMQLVAINTDAMWFRRRLGTATGIKRVIWSLSMGIIPTFHIWLIGRFGWRNAYAILGILVLVIMGFILAALFRDRPESIGALPDGDSKEREETESSVKGTEEVSFTPRQAFQTRAYWIVAAGVSLWSMIGTGIQFNIQPIFLEHGFTVGNAATWFTFFSVTSAVMFLLAGILADHLRPNFLLPFSLAAMIAGILLMIRFDSVLMGYSSAVALGISHSFFFTVYAIIFVRYYGRAHLGKIRGALLTISVGSSSVGPFVMGFIKDQFGGYSVSLWIFSVIVLPVAILSFLATRPKQPHQE